MIVRYVIAKRMKDTNVGDIFARSSDVRKSLLFEVLYVDESRCDVKGTAHYPVSFPSREYAWVLYRSLRKVRPNIVYQGT